MAKSRPIPFWRYVVAHLQAQPAGTIIGADEIRLMPGAGKVPLMSVAVGVKEGELERVGRGSFRLGQPATSAAIEADERLEFNAALWLDGELSLIGADITDVERGEVLLGREEVDRLRTLLSATSATSIVAK
jgi:hypothetical protein